MLGLEMPLHPQAQQQPQPQPPPPPPQQEQLNPQYHSQMVAFAQHHPQAQHPVKQHGYFLSPKTKQHHQLSPISDDDELGLAPDESAGDRKRKTPSSPWQRMKWTDNMVKLLILAVLYIGEEVGSEGNDKKKFGALLQKKGKWKSVSRAMMERGFYVSPQQCEDKFNDLNKRYKRVNEILGKGTACRVVENQSLLETLDLTPKVREEVKKLLNSKHLFFKEMCAYHNNCGHSGGTSGTSGANHSPEVATDPSKVQHQQAQHRSLHSLEGSYLGSNLSSVEMEGSKLLTVGTDEEDLAEEEDESDEDEYGDDDDEAVGNPKGQKNRRGQEDEDDSEEKRPLKRAQQGSFQVSVPPLILQLRCEVSNMIQDGAKSAWEKKQWMRMRLLQLEEERVSYQFHAVELEKQRLKWLRFSSKKEWEMEKAKLENERKRLENERMLLVLRQKEHALVDHHRHHNQLQSSTKRSDPPAVAV